MLAVRAQVAAFAAITMPVAMRAHADPAPAAPPEPTAADVAGAPPPGLESGRADGEVGDSTWRIIARDALFVPKLAVDAALTPIRGAIWLDERYHLQALYRRIFFNDAYTIGLYPTARFDSLFGVSVGARFVDRDVLGAREHVALQATTGGEYRAQASASLRTGDRLGDHVELGLYGDWERRPHDPFYGIGNADTSAPPPVPVDPRVDTLAVETSHREQLARAALGLDLRAFDGVHVIATSAVTKLAFGPGDNGTPIDQAYMTGGLVGYDGVEHLYDELELRVDRRRQATPWEPRAVYAAGWLVAAFAGRVDRIDRGPDFWRYGVELQQFLRLARGPRVIAVRFHGEGVSGSRDEVPFSELPKLGGGSFLRGYAYDRFRDRLAAVGSLEYQWDLGHYLDASVFVDAGRVYASAADLGLDHLRVGYGIAAHLHSDRGFLLEGSLSSSIDGNIYVTLAFNRVYDAHTRWR